MHRLIARPRPALSCLPLFRRATLLAGVACLAAPGASAQLQSLDAGQMVDGLRQYGLSDLLVYYAENEAPDDGLTPQRIAIAGHRLTFEDAAASADDRAVAIAAAIAEQQALIQNNRDHPQRAIWQTDLAEMVLMNQLTVVHQLAPDFIAFGVPTAEQTDAFNAFAGLAAVAAQQAQEHTYDLQGTLPATRGYTQRYVNTGLADRIFENYGKGLTPMFEGMAALYASMLPDDAPYWAGARDQVLMAQADRDAERQRLVELAVTRLTEFMDTPVTIAPGYQRAAKTALGMAQSRAGQHDRAVQTLTEVVEQFQDDLAYVRAGIAKAFAEERAGKPDVALRTLGTLLGSIRANHPDWIYQQLLVTDARFRLLGQAGGDTDPYEAYFTLIEGLEDPTTRAGIEAYLAQRWEQTIGDTTDPAALAATPVAVRDAVGAYRALQGFARNGADPSDPQARTLLTGAVPLNQSLLDEPGDAVPPATRLRAAYHLSLAEVSLAPSDPDARVRAANRIAPLADAYPAEPEAENALRAAALWTQAFHAQVRDRIAQFPELDAAYRGVCDVLLRDFATTQAADDARSYYAGQVLFNQDADYARAAQVLDGVPRTHGDYFTAQSLRLKALWSAYRASDETSRAGLLAQLTRAASRVESDARDAGPEQQDTARQAVAQARLATASVSLASGDPAQTLATLEGFEDQYVTAPEDAPLRVDATQTRLFALSAMGDDQGMKDTARRFMDDFPDQAAGTISRVVNDVAAEIDQLQLARAGATGLRAQELDEQITAQGEVAYTLANLLVQWSQGSTSNATPDQQTAFRLLEAKSLWLIGNAAEAVRILAPIQQANGNNLQVVHHYAEALYHLGLEADPPAVDPLRQAFSLYGSIDNSLKNNPDPGPFWWNARLRQLQVFDAVQPEKSRDIIRNIRQLEARDASLGGSPYREGFQRLIERHAAGA